MLSALYRALYIDNSPFTWIYFTQHGTIAGRRSKHPCDTNNYN